MMSGLPALPIAVIRPSRTPTSALTMPQWSRMTAPVMTRSGAPSARVASAWPIDSRITFPPPNTASSPPAHRSRSTSIVSAVSASLIRSPAVGPYSSAYLDRLRSTIRALFYPTHRRRLSPVKPPPADLEAGDDTAPPERHQRYLALYAWLEPDGGAGRDVQPVAPGGFPVEGERRVGLRE